MGAHARGAGVVRSRFEFVWMIGYSLIERALFRNSHDSPMPVGATRTAPTQMKVRLRSVLGMTNRGISAFAIAAKDLTLSGQFLVPLKVSVLPPFSSQASTRLGTCGVGFSSGISPRGDSVRLLGSSEIYPLVNTGPCRPRRCPAANAPGLGHGGAEAFDAALNTSAWIELEDVIGAALSPGVVQF